MFKNIKIKKYLSKGDRAGLSFAAECIFAAVMFFLVTMPFRRLFALTEVTEVRPAGALPPAFGLLFGLPGALGCAIGNLVADILSGYPVKICIYGFPAQFFYGYIPYLFWHGIGGRKKNTPINLGSVRLVLKYIGIVFADTLYMAVTLGLMLQLMHRGSLLSQDTLLLFFNNLAFSLILGIPIIIAAGIIRAGNRRNVITLTVRFVLIFLLLSVTSAAFMGIDSYGELGHYTDEPVELWNQVYIRVSVDFFLLCGLSVCFLWYLEKNITVPIETLAQIARNYADREKLEQAKKNGQKDEIADRKENSRDMMEQCENLSRIHGEPGYLAAAFQKMLQDVERYIVDITGITQEKERIRTELKVASHIQEDMLPDSHTLLANREDFTIRASMTPAKEVGGDFYDFFLLDDDHLAFLVADVSGKGVPAALFMVVAKTLLQNWTRNTFSASEAFTNTNRDLCRDNKNGMFVTAWMGILTLSNGKLTCVNAGHTRPLLRQRNDSYSYVEGRSGFVLAGLDDTCYLNEEIQLEPGDTLFLYTDGVTEANDKEDRLYGEGRLKAALNKKADALPEEILSVVWNDVAKFQGEAEQFDDITMMALRYNVNKFREIKGPADMSRMKEIMEFAEEILIKGGMERQSCEMIRTAIDEIYSNICHYSKAIQTTAGIRVVHYSNGKKEAFLYFEDDGLPFNPLEKPDPDVKEDMNERRVGGLGIYLVKKQMDRVSYEHVNGRNRLTVVKGEDKKIPCADGRDS